MRVNIISTLLLSGVLLVAANSDLQAQENRQVEVTKAYKPEVASATKLLAPTTIEDDMVIEPEINYEIKPDSWRTDLDAHDFKPATTTYWDFNRPKPSFLKLGVGYPLISNLAYRYALQSNRVGYFGVGVEHNGNFVNRYSAEDVRRDVDQSYDMTNGIELFGGVIAGLRMFEADVAYNYDIFNRYAAATADRLDFHNADVSMRFGDNFVNLKRLNFEVEAHGGYWSHNIPGEAFGDPYGEYRVGGSARVARSFYGNVIGISVGYDMWSSGDLYDYRDSRFDVGVSYARKFGIVNTELSVGYMYDKVRGREKASHFVLPKGRVTVDMNIDAFTPYIELDTKVSQNGVASLYKRNPYIDFVAMADKFTSMANTLSYDLALGFSGSVGASRFAYRAYVGANFMRDQLLWYVTAPGLFGATTANNTRLIFGAELGYYPIGGLYIGGAIRGHVDNLKSAYRSDEAKLTASLDASYTLRKWKFYASADYIGRRVWSSAVLDSEGRAVTAFEVGGKVDLRVGVSYEVSNRIEVFADGLNLLNSKIYDFADYYRNGIGFRCGIKVQF